MMKRDSRDSIWYLAELVIVAFGVFLGLYANELQSNRRIKLEKEKSINFIVQELKKNRKKLEQSYTYHGGIKIQLDSIARVLSRSDLFLTYFGNQKFKHDQIKGWNGVQNANIDDTAFEATKISGIIKEFPIQEIQRISEIYKFQNEYSDIGKSILNKMINFNSETKISDVFGSIDLITSDLKNYEKSLIRQIDQTISLLEATN